MFNPIRSVIHAARRKPGDRLKILTFSVHESTQSNQSGCNADFYCMQGEGLKKWDSKYRRLPKNFTLIDSNDPPRDVQFDIVLSQNKFAHWKQAYQHSRQLHIPLINLEHCLPSPSVPLNYFDQYKSMGADLNLFISEFNRDAWGYKDTPNTKVITHGVDTNIFKLCDAIHDDMVDFDERLLKRQKTILTVCNDYINRDWCLNYSLYKEVTKGLPVTPVGATPGLSEAAKSLDDLVRFYRTSQVFLNTSSYSPIPCALLEAAACGCGIVSSMSACTPEIFTHGHDILMTNNKDEMRGYLELLLTDKKECVRLGTNARETILKKCSLPRFVAEWDGIFENLLSETFIP